MRSFPRRSVALWPLEVSVPLSAWDGRGTAPAGGGCELGDAPRKEDWLPRHPPQGQHQGLALEVVYR
jgi:hypothetical protein